MTAADFADTFAALRAVLLRHRGTLRISVDEPGDFQVASPTRVDRTGRPLFVAAVQIKKNYVSFHFIPIYAVPDLLQTISPELRRRMQGKSCFNFTTITPAQVKELARLTRTGLARFETIALPWDEARARAR
jgi:hypothetical protein